jgi:hypothetical protein
VAKTEAKFIVIVLSMKPRWLRRNPGSSRLRLRILSKPSFDKIRKNNSPQPTLGKKYRRWVKEDGQRTCSTMLEGWVIAKKWKVELESNNRKVDLKNPSGYQVYIMAMKNTVWDNSKFSNFKGQPLKEHSTDCCYVGLTSSSPNIRYQQHCSQNHRASTKWGRQFFETTFKEAYRKDLLGDYKNAGFDWENLSASEAYEAEEHLARWLQKRKLAAYFS